MDKIYEEIVVNNLIFKFKYDFDPVAKDYLPHIFVRHLVNPEEVIASYLNKSEELYNNKYDRYEAYSNTDDITFYYIFTNAKMTRIFIISAMKGYLL